MVEVFERYKDKAQFHLEIKARTAEGVASRACDLVRGFGMVEATVITSFRKPCLVECKRYAPEIATDWLLRLGPQSTWDNLVIKKAASEGFTQIGPRADLIFQGLVKTLHRKVFQVRCRGVSDEAMMVRVINSGADRMTINFPRKLTPFLKDKGYIID